MKPGRRGARLRKDGEVQMKPLPHWVPPELEKEYRKWQAQLDDYPVPESPHSGAKRPPGQIQLRISNDADVRSKLSQRPRARLLSLGRRNHDEARPLPYRAPDSGGRAARREPGA